MPKRNLYVDDDLDNDIRTYDIPLSPVCQAALRDAVAHARRLRSATADLVPVVTRLRHDRAHAARQAYEQGFKLGAEWARQHAPWTELARFTTDRSGRRRATVLLETEAPSLRHHLLSYALNLDPDNFDETGFERLDDDDPFHRGVIDAAVAVQDAVTPFLDDTDGETPLPDL